MGGELWGHARETVQPARALCLAGTSYLALFVTLYLCVNE